ncbi:hypothetical protein HPB52_010923 [Rhipicephalus sanguineus]|uniref:Uncharacterized protein n=1 Tax=Rhipicephalus sanguineus TaxID=34632 RepID=A0A9D4Q8T0_RHISA|nr:hypothetical protein HPB52_010923 [Rhipicephalus sanguineus]
MDIKADIPATGDALVFSANQWAELEGATGWLTGAVVDYHSPCSVTPDRPCHIVAKLVALNELLFPSRMQLQEIPGTRGLLALGSMNDSVPSMAEPPDLRLRQSTSLMRRLLKHHKCISTLYVGPLHFQQYMSLICDALPYSRLKKLRLLCVDSLMSENGCAALSSLRSLEELDCSFISLPPSSFSRYISAEFPTALAALVQASHSLGVLRIEGVIMEEHATKNLLLYLTESGVLKDVTLGRRVVPETCREELAHYLMFTPSVIVQSLSKNNSIKELVLYVYKMSDIGVESLADTVKQSTNIRKLAFLDSGTTSVNAFVNRLYVDIMDNHTLLGVFLQGQMHQGWLDASKKVFTIYEATRRNSDLLATAAAFTKTTELDRRSTAALERIYKLHAELLEDLAELVEVNVAEIGGMAHRHLQRTAGLDEFMRITGVVKEQVLCHPRHDGCTQLDDLNEDCWGMVRQYLMLDDVEEVVTHLENL